MKKRLIGIEAVRGIACLLVVFCHFELKAAIGTYIMAVARFAVPFFLVVSGYFSFKDTKENSIAYSKRQLIATVKLTAIGVLICAISNSLVSVLKGDFPLKWFLDVCNLKEIAKFLIFNRAHWLSSVMYYLFMMIYIYLIHIFVYKINALKLAYFCIPLLIVANLILSKIVDNWYYVGNFLITGIPFFYLGHFIRGKGFRVGKTKSIVLLFFGLLLTLFENYLWGSDYCYVGTVLLVLGSFFWGINENDSKPVSWLAKFGTNYSMLVFLLHCSVGSIFKNILSVLGIDIGIYMPFAVIAITIVVSSIYLLLRRAVVQRKAC